MGFCPDPALLPRESDVLLVLNADVPIDHIIELAKGAQTIVAVTTHAFYPQEEADIRERLGDVCFEWLPMSWLLDDAAMEGCDADAIAELAPDGGRVDAATFMRRSRALRNERAAATLARHVAWRRAFAADGLGIAASAWPDARLIQLPDAAGATPASPSPATRLKQLLAMTRVVLVEGAGERFAFMGSVGRLRCAPGVRVRGMRVPLLAALARGDGLSPVRRLLTGTLAVLGDDGPVEPAPTVHRFAPWMLRAFPALRVFVDGLHPPNYPVAYGVAFRGARIVPREACDAEWFAKCGCEVLPRAAVLAEELPYGDPSAPRAIRNVALMLNHAGDWTALIDRSDTDLVVQAFLDAAEMAPEFTFRVRAHPTMAAAEHDGLGSRVRMRAMVEARGLPNVEFSEHSFDADMAWTECCVTEYSNVLVDCLKAGKPSVALNPTNRRNLLAHLAPIGLREVADATGLVRFLRAVNRETERAANAQGA